ncbi:hypothetical protein E2C01_023220 [Portunus trituberculatus]|uniref:Uncharacterized protein n=1 Tax=Portunus trituberculatus TaxID=210409 RepID=A0A5B7E9T6_PORTR|nr:hypothetical protein [Portunus trituberculatus]
MHANLTNLTRKCCDGEVQALPSSEVLVWQYHMRRWGGASPSTPLGTANRQPRAPTRLLEKIPRYLRKPFSQA